MLFVQRQYLPVDERDSAFSFRRRLYKRLLKNPLEYILKKNGFLVVWTSFLRLSESSNSQNSKKKTTTLLSTSARKVQDEQTEPPLCNIDYLQSYLTLFHFCVLSLVKTKRKHAAIMWMSLTEHQFKQRCDDCIYVICVIYSWNCIEIVVFLLRPNTELLLF